MRKISLFHKGVCLAIIAVAGGLFLNSCSKDDVNVIPTSQEKSVAGETTRSSFGWWCKDLSCQCFNSYWRNVCMACGTEKSPEHGRYVLSLQDLIKLQVAPGGNITENNIGTRIELPGKIFLEYGPENWFDAPKALKYYNDLKTLYYNSNAEYAEGVDFGWYRTVRMLYPGKTNLNTALKLHDKWLVTEGRTMKGAFNSGIKDGTKAALDAFGAR